MRQGKAGFKVWVLVILGLGLWAPGALAFWPPCQQVTAWLDGTAPNQTIRYKVWDTKKGAYVEGSWTDPQASFISSPGVSEGMVFWQVTYSSHQFRVYSRVYDPGRSSWQGDEVVYTEYPAGLRGGDGVITWMVTLNYPYGQCMLRTYDPGPGVWKSGEIEHLVNDAAIVSYYVSNGVVAWFVRTLSGEDLVRIYFAIYDPSRGDWRVGGDTIPMQGQGDPMPGLTIGAGTVYLGNSRFDYRYGYDATSGAWSRGLDTQPLSRFVAQPTKGKAPLWVWFTDMSIPHTTFARSLTFGDGGSSSLPSPSHTYATTGKFTVTQEVVAPWITRSSSQEITVTATGPTSTPALDLLLLE
jgi:hypothetical protein